MNTILSIFSLILTFYLTNIFCFIAKDTCLMDTPNERSMHTQATIRGGGVIFIGLFIVYLTLLYEYTKPENTDVFYFLISLVSIALMSFIDDLYNLSAKLRLIVQSILAIIISINMRPELLDLGVLMVENQWLITGFIFFIVLWSINHFNFMDGVDGLCASQAIFLLISYAFLFGINNALYFQTLCIILAANLLGFLWFNFPPAKLFMGDIGSASLGLIFICIAIIAQKNQIPLLYFFILNSLFLFDATITLLRRIIHKEKWFAPHKKHAYQRLKLYGVKTRVILLGQSLVNCSFLAGVLLIHQNLIESSTVMLYTIILLLIIYGCIELIYPMVPIESQVIRKD